MTSPGPSRGSVLILCLAVVSALLLIAFAYVRIAALSHETSSSENRMLLAREAAKIGRDHAIEQILRDYVNGPFSRVDDGSHAAFVSHDRPYESDYSTDSAVTPQMLNVDSVPAENNLVQSFGGPYNDWNSLANQQHSYDGRGRYYEPGFYNLAVPGFTAAATQPTTPVRFGTPWATTDPMPDRSDGIFFDAHFKRIAGDPRTARTQARFRLRYAVGVTDLDSEILVNGDPAVPASALTGAGPLDSDPDPAHALTPAERVLRWKHALPAIVTAGSKFGQLGYGWGAGVSGGSRAEHVFMGRGCTANFDLVAGVPVTFPFMYRNGSIGVFLNATSNGPADSLYLSPASAGGGTAIPNDQGLIHALTGPQFSFNNYDAAIDGRALESGGEGNADALGRFTPFGRGLVQGTTGRWSGKVDTPWCVNIMTAPAGVVFGMLAGYMPPGAVCTWYHETPPGTPSIANGKWLGRSYASGLYGARDLFVKELSPAFGPGYGAYITPSRASPAVSIDYHAPDARTAAQRYPGPIAFNGNPGSGWSNDNLGVYLRATAMANALSSTGGEVDASGRPEVARGNLRYKESATFPNPGQPRNELTYWGASSLTGSSNTRTGGPPPGAVTISLPTWSNTVDYRVNDLVKFQGATDPPGTPGTYLALKDNLAQQPDVVVAPPAGPYWNKVADPVTGWDSTVCGAHPDSIWDVIGNAMAVTITQARGQYYQYTHAGLGNDDAKLAPPSVFFNGSPWSGARIASIKDIDAAFVANLGSDPTHPNSPVPVAAWKSWSGYNPDFQYRLVPFTGANAGDPATPTWNLAKLRTATTTVEVVTYSGALIPRIKAIGTPPKVDLGLPQAPVGTYTFPIAAWNDPAEPRYDSGKPSYSADDRTAIAELIINDVRLSFFGSSPQYGDDFRALDLNGDGKAHCSGFRASGGSGPLFQYTSSVDGNGIATVPVDSYFANTGVFFVGRSRFWRIMVRGELWDNVLQSAVNCAQLDSVLCVDPVNEAREWAAGGTPDPAKGQYATHLLYQRWFYNVYRGLMPRQQQ